MSDPTRVSRTVDTDLAPDELWDLVTDGAAWATWMVDTADVAVEPGADGTVVDDGVARTVHIDRRDDRAGDRCVGFTWWPQDRPDLVSAVELVVLPASSGSRLRVTETFASAAPTRTSPAWDVRLLLLAVRALAVLV